MSSSFGRGARGAVASVHVKRWRTATVALLVLAMVGSLLALAVPPPSVAGAQEPPPEQVTEASWATDCIGTAAGIRQPETNSMAFETTAPTSVEPGADFTIRIAPKQSEFPDSKDSIVGVVPVHYLQNVNFMYDLPSNASVESVEVVAGTGFGTTGTPTVAVDTEGFSPGRIVLFVPMVPKNPIGPDKSTPFQLPAIDVALKATGPVGSSVVTRFSGHDEATSGYVFQASSVLMANVWCWPVGEVARAAAVVHHDPVGILDRRHHYGP